MKRELELKLIPMFD